MNKAFCKSNVLYVVVAVTALLVLVMYLLLSFLLSVLLKVSCMVAIRPIAQWGGKYDRHSSIAVLCYVKYCHLFWMICAHVCLFIPVLYNNKHTAKRDNLYFNIMQLIMQMQLL